MQPDLPWNVAGIPPEARDAARAAARREGLSVGEWLTRRILRSFSDADDDAERDWHRSTLQDMEASMTADSSARDTDEMLAHVSRSESDAKDAYRRIEDQLRGVARRLDATERSQSENNRAMSKAATEINVATREQAQAFEQLGSHVVKLTDRIARVENQANNEPMRDAVKGLHQGLTRLADQISETAHQSADQIGVLAHNIESVAAKLAAAERATHALEEKLQTRIAGIDERMKPVEKTNEILDRLSTRFSAMETDTASAVSRLDEAVHQLQRDGGANAAMDKRLQGIEQALADLVGRLDAADRGAPPPAKVDDSLHNLAQQIEGAEKRHRESIADLRSALKDTAARIDAIDGTNVRDMPRPAASMSGGPMEMPPQVFDLPPFPQTMPEQQPGPFPEAAPGGSFDLPPPPYDLAPAPGVENMYTPPSYFAGNDVQQPQAANPASAESYIAAARRNARIAPAERDARNPNGGFTWGAPQAAAVTAKSGTGGKSRFVLIAIIALIAVAAAIAGMKLSQGLNNSAPPQTQTVAAPKPQPPVSSPNYNILPPQEPAQNVDHATPGGTTAAPAPKHEARTASSSPKLAPPPAKPTQSPLQRLTALATAGNARAETALGMDYLGGEGMDANEAEAARWFERAATQGQAVAAYRLGTLYERGHGVPADQSKAVHWYAVAANAGNRKAMHNLAVAYAEGNGVKKDLAEAANWFTKAATLGLADSQFNLAVLYERGMGVPQSLVNAYKWYAIAAAQGDAESKARIGALSTQLSPADRDTAQSAAASFKPMPMDRDANMPPDASQLAGG